MATKWHCFSFHLSCHHILLIYLVQGLMIVIHPLRKEKIPCDIWGSHSGDYEEFYLLGYNTIQSTERHLIFQSNILSVPSGLKSKGPHTHTVWRAQLKTERQNWGVWCGQPAGRPANRLDCGKPISPSVLPAGRSEGQTVCVWGA
jgi:hypothetical protein